MRREGDGESSRAMAPVNRRCGPAAPHLPCAHVDAATPGRCRTHPALTRQRSGGRRPDQVLHPGKGSPPASAQRRRPRTPRRRNRHRGPAGVAGGAHRRGLRRRGRGRSRCALWLRANDDHDTRTQRGGRRGDGAPASSGGRQGHGGPCRSSTPRGPDHDRDRSPTRDRARSSTRRHERADPPQRRSPLRVLRAGVISPAPQGAHRAGTRSTPQA